MSVIKLPLIFQEGVVLQHGKPICIWGEAQTDEPVYIQLGEHNAVAPVKDGHWKAFLEPMGAASGLELTVSAGLETIHISDVAVGEVWIAGGQSNMEFLLKHDAQRAEAAQRVCEDVRCFEVPKISFPGQESYFKMSEAGVWRKENPSDSLLFNAIGYFFANRLHEALEVPVGIINCTWGGTSASCWVSEEYLTGELQFYLDKAREVQSNMDYEKELPGFIEIQKRMLASNIDMGKPNFAPVSPLIDSETHQRLMTMNNWPFSPFRPCGLHGLMLKTIVPYTVSGVIWYQGESDEYFSEHYEAAMKAVIQCWRDEWQQPLPFIMVQLAAFEVMAEYLDFVSIRKAQERIARTVPQVYLVTAMDVGMRYDIHPKQKKPVALRLANQALDKVYGMHLPADSPTFLDAERSPGRIVLRMKHTGTGLCLKGEKCETFDILVNGQPKNADIQISGHDIVVSSPEIENADEVTVKFCQRPWCVLNIYNSSGLPVLPFTAVIPAQPEVKGNL